MPSFLPASLGKLWGGGSSPLLSPSPFPFLGELGALGWRARVGRWGRAGKGLLDFLQLYLSLVPCLQVPDSLVGESVVTLEPLLSLRLFSLWFSATGHTSSAWSHRVLLAPPVL